MFEYNQVKEPEILTCTINFHGYLVSARKVKSVSFVVLMLHTFKKDHNIEADPNLGIF